MDCHFLLQGIFPTQGLNAGLPHCRQMLTIWATYSHLFQNFPQLIVIHTVKGFDIVNKVEVFLELSCCFDDPADVGNLISGSFVFSKSSLNIWKFMVTFCWSLAWRILSIILLACEMSWLTGKDPDAERNWGQEEKGTTEDEIAGWHHRINTHEFGWTLGVGDGQGGLACCNLWGCKELDMIERLNWKAKSHITKLF